MLRPGPVSAIQIKDVPEDLHERLRRLAAAAGMSLRAHLLKLIEGDLALPTRREWLGELRREPVLHGTSPAAETLRELRNERTDHLSRADDRR